MGNFKVLHSGPTRIAKFLVGTLYVAISVLIVCTVLEWLLWDRLNNYLLLIQYFGGGFYSASRHQLSLIATYNLSVQIGGITQFFVLTGAGVLLLCWIYGNNARLRDCGVQGLKFTAAWSVGWWFVPIACLWKPYQAIREIWRANFSVEETAKKRQRLLLAWWISLLISNFFGGLSIVKFLVVPNFVIFATNASLLRWFADRYFVRASNEEAFFSLAAGASAQALISDVFAIIAAVLLIRIVRRITEVQSYSALSIN